MLPEVGAARRYCLTREAMVVLTGTMAWEEGLEWVAAVEVVMAWEVLP